LPLPKSAVTQAPVFFFCKTSSNELLICVSLCADLADPIRELLIVGIDEKTVLKHRGLSAAAQLLRGFGQQACAGWRQGNRFRRHFSNSRNYPAGAALQKLEAEVKSSASSSVLKKIKELEQADDPDAQFAAAMKKKRERCFGHLFLASRMRLRRLIPS